jgi:hypothetical protein
MLVDLHDYEKRLRLNDTVQISISYLTEELDNNVRRNILLPYYDGRDELLTSFEKYHLIS